MVGIPGIGISGIFYLAAALLLPVFSFFRRRGTGRQVKWRNVRLVFGLSLGILVMVWLTGWVLGIMLEVPSGWLVRAANSYLPEDYQNIVRLQGYLTSFTVLIFVLLMIQGIRLVIGKPQVVSDQKKASASNRSVRKNRVSHPNSRSNGVRKFPVNESS